MVNTSITIVCTYVMQFLCTWLCYKAVFEKVVSNVKAVCTIEDTLDDYMVHIRLLNGLS